MLLEKLILEALIYGIYLLPQFVEIMKTLKQFPWPNLRHLIIKHFPMPSLRRNNKIVCGILLKTMSVVILSYLTTLGLCQWLDGKDNRLLMNIYCLTFIHIHVQVTHWNVMKIHLNWKQNEIDFAAGEVNMPEQNRT